MTDFDPNSLTWKVFVNVVREKHGHELTLTAGRYGSCRKCGLGFAADRLIAAGWLTYSYSTSWTATAPKCPETRSRP